MPAPIVTREEWGAVPPNKHIDESELPSRFVIMTIDEGNVPPCTTPEECTKSVKLMQKFYMEIKNLPDIPYNFIIGNDGRVYEGRGWKYKPQKSYSLPEYKYETVDIGVITGFVNLPMAKREIMEEAAIDFVTDFINDNTDEVLISDEFEFKGFTGQYCY